MGTRSLQQSEMDETGESRFYMWRALFALAHADNFLALEEQGMLAGYLDKLDLPKAQMDILREDMATPQDVDKMFLRVSEARDREEFFELARKLVWADGDFGEQEQALMARLEALHNTAKAAAAESKSPQGFLKNFISRFCCKGDKA